MKSLRAEGGDAWSEVVSRSFYPLVTSGAPEGFRATLTQRDLARGVSVAEVSSAPNVLTRTSRLVRTAPSDDMLLLVQLTGSSLVTQADRQVRVHAGSATLCDPLVEYTVEAENASHQIVVMLPRSTVKGLSVPVDATRLRPIPGSLASLRALVAVSEETLSVQDEPHYAEADVLAGALLDLSRATFLRLTGGNRPPASREALLASVRAHVTANAHDPALDADSLAHAVGLSPRQLGTLLHMDDLTPARLIRRERLHTARSLLLDPSATALSVAEIALRSGFSDPTTFARAFRREYGELPSDVRHRRGE